MPKILIGSHCSMNGTDNFLGSVKEAISYKATAFMIYTGAPQNTIRKPLSELKIPEAQKLMAENNISLEHLIIHAPYIINPASDDVEKHNFAISFLTNEVKRSYAMGAKIMVLHPGNSLDLDVDTAILNIASVVNSVIENTPNCDVVIALETMAGKGSEVGRTFNEVKQIMNNIVDKKRIGVCLDTCHINDAGYDIVNHYEEVLKEFDKIIGFNNLKVIHLNDSKNELGAHKDRHANVGEGFIGFEPLHKFVHDERFVNIPKILETPYRDGLPPYKEEIAMLVK